MAEADAATIEDGTPGHFLMERAGRAVAREVVRTLGARYGCRVVVVCGKGNNGGDGFVVARRLLDEGYKVVCCDPGVRFAPTGAPLLHLERLKRQGVELRPFEPGLLEGADIVVDAIFGTGFRGAIEGEVAQTVDAMNSSRVPVIAIDIPSGVDGETGAVHGTAIRATRTVAFASEKLGTALAPGAEFAGPVSVVDIGIAVPDSDVHVVEAADVAAAVPVRASSAHKRSNGSVALLAGSLGMSGAALLAAEGAMRAGAGYVTLGSTVEVIDAANVALPEVLKRVLWDGNGMTAVALERFADVIDRADALAIGPGLRAKEGQRSLVTRVLERVELPIVLDADGLNVLATDPAALSERIAPTLITPHPGELARLLGTSVTDVQNDRLAAARAGARRFSCAVLLKGFRTIVAEPGGRAVVIPTGGPELATAGTGDVLCGIVATLLAQHLGPFEAGWAAAYIHGLAGSVAGQRRGRRGVVASDVVDAVPEAMELLEPLD